MTRAKYSCQRAAIKKYLSETKSHPTAEVVYENIQKIYPKISLGTVYRNLNFLADRGEIIRLSCADKKEHFDADTSPHSHFYCSECHGVSDLDIPMVPLSELTKDLHYEGTIENYSIFYSGICPECAKS